MYCTKGNKSVVSLLRHRSGLNRFNIQCIPSGPRIVQEGLHHCTHAADLLSYSLWACLSTIFVKVNIAFSVHYTATQPRGLSFAFTQTSSIRNFLFRQLIVDLLQDKKLGNLLKEVCPLICAHCENELNY